MNAMPLRGIQPTDDDWFKIQHGMIDRASGDTICDKCGKKFYDHPWLFGFGTTAKLCNGELVKL